MMCTSNRHEPCRFIDQYLNMKPITIDTLIKCGADPRYANQYVAALNENFPKYGIITLLRAAHFLSQILHESINLSATEENLNYSAAALMKTWKTRFPTMALANQYARQPQKIANYVYANRLGNGPRESGDGWRYRGRGPMQATGKDKYIDMTDLLKIDFVANPQLLALPKYGIVFAFQYWKNNNINKLADLDSCEQVTRVINGGQIGIVDRKLRLAKCKVALASLFE